MVSLQIAKDALPDESSTRALMADLPDGKPSRLNARNVSGDVRLGTCASFRVTCLNPSQDRVGPTFQICTHEPRHDQLRFFFRGRTTTGAGSNTVPAHFGPIDEDSLVLNQWSAARSRNIDPSPWRRWEPTLRESKGVLERRYSTHTPIDDGHSAK
jgi:hypothetical protein